MITREREKEFEVGNTTLLVRMCWISSEHDTWKYWGWVIDEESNVSADGAAYMTTVEEAKNTIEYLNSCGANITYDSVDVICDMIDWIKKNKLESAPSGSALEAYNGMMYGM